MKRYGNIYEEIYDMDNLKLAHKNARKDKLYYKEVKMVDSDEEYYLKQIQEILKDETYKVSDYTVSIINDKGKSRELMKLPYFPDRIIQWAIMLQIEHIFMEVFTNFTCASIKDRGIHKASSLLDGYMEDVKETQYCLKIDISKFYPNIDHDILKFLLRKKFKDKKLLKLLYKIIDSTPGSKGVPIGSYLSQFLRFKRQMTKIRNKCERGEKLTYSEWCSGNSYKGWLIWCDGYRLSNKYITPIQKYLDDYYITEIKEIKEIKERKVA